MIRMYDRTLVAKIADWDDHIGRRLRLRDLRVFFAVMQAGSLTQAAQHLRVSHPAVSQVIADLEHTLGVNGGDISDRWGAAKAGQWREEAPACKGARSGPLMFRRRDNVDAYDEVISPVSGSTLVLAGAGSGSTVSTPRRRLADCTRR